MKTPTNTQQSKNSSKPSLNSSKQQSWEERIEKSLEISWAIDNVMGKPDKVQILGYPKGGYHLTYNDFIERLTTLISQIEAEAVEEIINQMDISMELVAEGMEVPILLVNGEFISSKEELVKALTQKGTQ